MTTYPVTLVFADGAACTVEVAAGQNIVQAFAAHGYALLTDCSEGRCGTCMGRLLTGSVELGAYDEQTLLDDDRSAGMTLPCVAAATQPCVIELPYDFAEVTADDVQIRGSVADIDPIASEVVRFVVNLEEPLAFLPGQYVCITPEGQSFTRSYSMANPPGERRAIFYARLVERGVFSTWLTTQAKPGCTVLLSRPHGSFFLRDEKRPRPFVAGGTGLAPFLSMLHAMSESPTLAQPTQILIGARTQKHLFGISELDSLKSKVASLSVRILVEQPDGTGLLKGFATDAISEETFESDARAYLCGPPPMVEAGRKALARFNMPPADILCERFT
ncbi:MAG: 2Fe-2S iron-sulfur cluster-binding protein [Pseudorhodoplanes sp.]|uniref:2Fe-2S iron-sulfur cluster-binding protein n=1 Tax=Pseudorhodoplanes sp. TaxID=1934341 RepID=UPI003D13A1E2